MVPASGSSVTSLEDLRERLRGFQESRILLTAVELDVFTAVGEEATGEDVARKLGTDERATEMLLHALVALGALTKSGDLFHNTSETTRFLVAGSPEYMRPALLHTVNMWDTWSSLTECVRAGTAVRSAKVIARDPQWTQNFITAMHAIARERVDRVVAAVGAGGVSRLLDIGGGSGAYSIGFAEANPEVRAEVFDQAEVLPIAQRHIQEAGLSDRVTTRAGDLTQDDFGENYDFILLSAICHMLSPEQNRDLFRRCRRALTPRGRIVVRDFILDEERTAPRRAAVFALNMLVATPSGSTYTESEYRDWLEGTGFGQVERLGPSDDLIVASCN